MPQQDAGAAIAPDVLDRINAREADVLGHPPRLPPLDRASVAEAVQAATARLRGGVVGDTAPLPLDVIPEIMFTLCRYPDLWDRIMDLSLQIQGPSATLPARFRQLAILRTAWLLQAPYEWGEHVKHSKRVGLTDEDVEWATIGSSAPGWTPQDRAILRVAEELREAAMVSDATWEEICTFLDDQHRFELLVLIGQFTNVAYFQNSLRLRLEPSNPGLKAR
ncbi:carboxymuconolactone decarboxylase family protein [Sphingobium sufflavum]|uniref:carboxymuconolactone decarboxylase family protein n=1 Tax=Sphingobium sufflavum TaxID=1129547 RepID=UPI001F3D3B00|nr:carboxymuconolactone decarboxylase family protein [Sphingobium sufflavum]MCE7797082.1 carboxymuconolactone decarboxylase family protein [Sphingobium sufflavum]